VTVVRKPSALYRTPEDDSTRWHDFPFRPGDIVVSTSHKCGTTWTQTICALLVFQEPDLPGSLADLSPWLDQSLLPVGEVYARLSAQRHRRVIKTHTPLDGLPLDPRVSYIVVGRDPLDVCISRFRFCNEEPALRVEMSERDWLLQWIDRDDWEPDSLNRLMWHISDAWTRRDEPNVILTHYADLSADLGAEMRRLAARLAITVPDDTWPELSEAATFRRMRARSEQLIPCGVDPVKNFFRSGRSGAGRTLLTAKEYAGYRERIADLAPSDLANWLAR
jgi:aryl sulfotransferase